MRCVMTIGLMICVSSAWACGPYGGLSLWSPELFRGGHEEFKTVYSAYKAYETSELRKAKKCGMFESRRGVLFRWHCVVCISMNLRALLMTNDCRSIASLFLLLKSLKVTRS